jgi:hypothetical protein
MLLHGAQRNREINAGPPVLTPDSRGTSSKLTAGLAPTCEPRDGPPRFILGPSRLLLLVRPLLSRLTTCTTTERLEAGREGRGSALNALQLKGTLKASIPTIFCCAAWIMAPAFGRMTGEVGFIMNVGGARAEVCECMENKSLRYKIIA